MLKHSLIAAAVALFAAGCTMAPKYERPAAPVTQEFPQGGVYATQPDANSTASNGRTANGQSAPEIGWRDFFADARLQQIVALALKNNRDLRVSVLNVQAAQAQYRITRAGLFPTLDAAASQSKQRTPRNLSFFDQTISNTYSVGLNASWEIDFFGRIQSLKDQALAQYLSTAESRKAAEISLVSSVADQYLTMLAYDDQLVVTQNTLKTAQESYRITKLQFDNGTGSELDLRQSEGVVQQAQANLQAQARLRAQAENALVLLVGEPLPEGLPKGMPLDTQNLLSDIPAGLPSDLLTRRPDIAAAEQSLLAANANIGAARAAFFPKVSLTGSFGTLSPSLGGLFKPGSAAWSFAPTIDLPIFEGGQNVANLDLANIQKRVEIANYEKAIQTAFREVADGLAARGTYDEQIKSLERFVQSQSRRLELSDLRYRNGVDSYLTVLTAQTDLYSAQQLLITARLNRLTNLVDLYQYLGGGWIEHSGDAPRPADAPVDYGSQSAPQPASAPAG
ncbi:MULTISPECIES: efflux transporter outer membrane subunit [unclassified Caballeronia]|uniref:efflux transporter outer membrane subunit n=1 Tax=unclassified Caballeronia TaxID=2646786 RepID=UPI002866B81B|nr:MULTISPECIES: efflux transporter outer membrane subunit [unclassified Caballeronia]MDR5812512.1 efflux transporter outer membrane subunit [Caballeronia sp. LZ033]MDR5819365.1 efflux transporter outer membrane subunit [Caballeronia sp. LZ043]MDR5877133.1 efflux transporter outer membrane subunit [Caballeronia sp. LZ032]